MIPPVLVLFVVCALLPRALAECDELDAQACARTCVPFHFGTSKQTDFSCGDWWLRARCCNGTEPISIVTSVYYSCSCQADGMTTRGLVVILVLAFAAIFVVLAAVVYVLYRQKKRAKAEEEERDRAIEEAQVYLPR